MLREQKQKELCTALMEEKWMLRSTFMLNQNYHFNNTYAKSEKMELWALD